MSTTINPPQQAPEPAKKPKKQPAPAAKIRKVRGPWLALGGFLMTLAIAGALWLWQSTGARDQYLAINKDMARGDVIERGDLGLIGLSADIDLNLVRPGDADTIVGSRLVADLAEGTLLTPELVSTGETVPEGKVLVGLDLQAGQYPTANIGVGDFLAMVGTLGRNDGLSAFELARGEVISRTMLSDSNMRMFLTVAVDEERANAVAGLAGAGQLFVVQTDSLTPSENELHGLPADQLPFDATGDGRDDATGAPLPDDADEPGRETTGEADDGQDS